MTTLLFLLLALAVFAGFLGLVELEGRRGARFLAAHRERLDQLVERGHFIATHVDLPAFVREEVRRLIARIGHDIAHLSLLAVRAVERLLTRAVKHLRSRHLTEEAPREQAREFVRTLSDFKENLRQKQTESDTVV